MEKDVAHLLPIVQKNALIKGMDATSLQLLLQRSFIVRLRKGELLFAMGDEARSLFIVLQGWIKVFRISRTGEEAVISIFGLGESFAEAGVFSDRQIYPVNAEAVEESIVLSVPRTFFVDKINEDSNFALRILGTIAARQNFLVQHMEQITTRSAPQRVAYFLLKFCQEGVSGDTVRQITLPYEKSVISTRLNMTPETFSRSLAALKEHGVTVEGAHVTLNNPEMLAEFCDIQRSSQLE